MMKFLYFYIFFLLVNFNHSSYANQCTFTSYTATQMVLMPIKGDSSNLAFGVNCDRSYMISFISDHGLNNNGVSYLQNGQSKIRTLLSVTGSNRIPWATNVLQKASNSNRYIINAKIIDNISPTLKAGAYSDQIHIMIEY